MQWFKPVYGLSCERAHYRRSRREGDSRRLPITLEQIERELHTRLILWSNLNGDLDLAIRIDSTVRQVRPDGWRGVQAKEQLIKAALYGVLQDPAEVERLFPVLIAQPEY